MFHQIVEKLIFVPEKGFSVQPEYFGLEYLEVNFATEDGLLLHGWYFPATSQETLLFLHGNAGNIADRLDNIYRFVKHDLSVFIFDYRGYGRSEGRASEEGTYSDARAAWAWLVSQTNLDPSRLVVFGRSLGGAVAIELATQIKPYRLIIESSFTSIKELGHHLIPFIPHALIPNIYPSIERIGSITCPVLFSHGTKDALIPFAHGQKLFKAALEPKYFYAIPNADHNDTYIVAGSSYFEKMVTFIRTGRCE